MGVNLFVPIRDASDAEMASSAANALGVEYDAFDWCAPFEGEAGALLTLEQALAFEDDAAPWFVALPYYPMEADNLLDGELFWCIPEARFENSQTQAADWRALLRESNCNTVLFIKARL